MCVCDLVWFNPLLCFFGSEGHVPLDRNPGRGTIPYSYD